MKTEKGDTMKNKNRVAVVKEHARKRARRDFETMFIEMRPDQVEDEIGKYVYGVWTESDQVMWSDGWHSRPIVINKRTVVHDQVALEARHDGDAIYAHYVRAYALEVIAVAGEMTARTFSPPRKTNANPYRQLDRLFDPMVDAVKEAIRYRAEVA